MILAAKFSGKIIAQGEFEENSTHYFKERTYYDKNSCMLLDLEEVDDIKKWKVDLDAMEIVRNLENNQMDYNLFIEILTFEK